MQIAPLVLKKLDGQLTAEEAAQLQHWLNASAANQELFDQLGEELEQGNVAEHSIGQFDAHAALESVLQRHYKKRQGQKKLLWYIATAASVLLAVWLMAHYLNKPTDYRNNDRFIALEDVAPGSVGATLTLANGKKIKLSGASNGELAKEAEMKITKTADGQLVYEIASSQNAPANDGAVSTTNTLSTAKGETYQVRLPDGTKVWLNAASSLTYAAGLNERGVRSVKLEGEAYLEVAKSKTRPFIVETGGQQIEVLGTHFNVNSYTDEGRTVTTLLEGSVKVRIASASGKPRHDVLLKPGEQSILTGSNILKTNADLSTAVAWKNGEFVFKNASVPEIMRQVARWYNLEIVYQGKVTNDTFTGSIDRNANLESVLKLFETAQIKFHVVQTPIGKKLILQP